MNPHCSADVEPDPRPPCRIQKEGVPPWRDPICSQSIARWQSPKFRRVRAGTADAKPIPDPEPIDFLLHVMDARGLTLKELKPFLGSRARVAEVLNRVCPLSLEMIRRLSTGFGIPAEVLIQPYDVTRAG